MPHKMPSRLPGVLLAILAISNGLQAQNPPVAPLRDPVLVTISEKTTRITEPLKPSGYPDFLEALNIAARGKITPATNGAILLVRAVGPHGISSGEQQAEFYDRLGIEPLPENHRRHVFHFDFIKNLEESELPPPTPEEKKIEEEYDQIEARRSRVELEFEHCEEHPWTAKEYQLVARWLRQQEKSLAQLDQLRDYPDAYLPQIASPLESSVIASELSMLQIIRHTALDLRIRAMNSLAQGKAEAAIDDLERIMVMSRYLQQRGEMVTQLVCYAVRGLALPLFNQLALSASLKQPQLERLQKLLDTYYPIQKAPFADIIDRDQRRIMIELVCRTAEFGDARNEKTPAPLTTRQTWDYDFILNHCNSYFDRLVEMMRIENSAERMAALDKYEDELHELSKKAKSPANKAMLSLTKTGRSSLLADNFVVPLAPAHKLIDQAEQRNLMRRELCQLSIALGKYRLKHGQFPKSLDQLAPNFLASIPIDRFTGKPLTFQSDGKGILVYSVGWDLEDHGGFDGAGPEYTNCDDMAIFTNDRRPKPPQLKPPRDITE